MAGQDYPEVRREIEDLLRKIAALELDDRPEEALAVREELDVVLDRVIGMMVEEGREAN